MNCAVQDTLWLRKLYQAAPQKSTNRQRSECSWSSLVTIGYAFSNTESWASGEAGLVAMTHQQGCHAGLAGRIFAHLRGASLGENS